MSFSGEREPKQKAPPRVLLAGMRNRRMLRDAALGVLDFAREQQTGWEFVRLFENEERSFLETGGHADAVIGNAMMLAEHLRHRRGPVVGVFGGEESRGRFPVVTDDDEEICRTGLDYFRRKGFRRVAFAGVAETWHPRMEVFARLAEEQGLAYSVFPANPASLASGFEEGLEAMRAWLQRLEPPLGILAFSESIGTQLLSLIRQLGLRSPDDFAVLGHGGGRLECEISSPPLSVIEADGWQVGREAALLLDRMTPTSSFPQRA